MHTSCTAWTGLNHFTQSSFPFEMYRNRKTNLVRDCLKNTKCEPVFYRRIEYTSHACRHILTYTQLTCNYTNYSAVSSRKTYLYRYWRYSLHPFHVSHTEGKQQHTQTGPTRHQSPTQWPLLKSRIHLCQRLTVLQDSCKMYLCYRFCLLEAFYCLYISLVVIYLILLFEVNILFEIDTIYRDYIGVYLF